MKVLLMGRAGSGKTSMRSLIFANYIARDTRRLGPTMDIEHTHFRLPGNRILNLWDCGGQSAFMESFFVHQKDIIFHEVEVIVYVFDITSKVIDDDLQYFRSCMEAVAQQSPNCSIFCLINKMDLVPEYERNSYFDALISRIRTIRQLDESVFYPTSIWDDSLFSAWSQIVYAIIPNIKLIEASAKQMCEVLEADEIILFERSTFLKIASHSRWPFTDKHRFDKISNIVKQFKLSCTRLGSLFTRIEIKTPNFMTFIDLFTSNTFIMVVCSDPSIVPSTLLLNIRSARKYFQKHDTGNYQHPSLPKPNDS